MTKKTDFRKLKVLMLGLTVLASALLSAEEIEKRTAVSEIETSEFEKSLEERLSRDATSYLGHNFFIIRADALLERVKLFDRTEEMVPAPQSQQPAPAQPEPLPLEEEPSPEAVQENEAVSQMELETEDGISQNSVSNLINMESPLPGLPVPDSVFSTEKQDKKAEQRRQQAQKKKQEQVRNRPAPPAPQPVKMEKKITETLKDTRVDTKKLSMKVLLDEHITPEQEVFIRQLVIEKSNLSFIRGDELQMLRSKFPGASVLDPKEEPVVEEPKIEEPVPVEEPVAEEKPVEPAPVEEPLPWYEEYWQYLAGAAAVLLLLLLIWALRRKPAPEPVAEPQHPAESEAAKKIEELIGRLNNKHDTITTNRLQAIREEVVSMAVEDFPIVKGQVTDWLNDPSDEGIERLAAMQNLLGEGHFSSLFRTAITPDKMIALALKSQEQLQEMQANDQLEMAEGVYQTLVQKRYREQHNPEQSVRPFSFLDKLNDDQVLFLLNDEGLKVKALVFSQMFSDRGASLLKRLSIADRSQVATEISEFSQLPVSAFRDVANRLARKAVNVPSFANISVDGVDLLVDMLDYMNTADETAMLNGLRKDNPELFYRIKQVYVGFNDLVRVPVMALKNIIRETEREELALALYDTSDKFREYIYAAMLDRPRAMLQSTLKSLETPDSVAVEDAKREISRRARAMLKAGAFVMPQEQKTTKPDSEKPKDNAA